MDEAVEIAHNAIFANHGQNCVAGSRTFVQSGIYDQFVKKATEKAKARKVGDPFTNGIQQGPQVNKCVDFLRCILYKILLSDRSRHV